jgi:secreted trypsin-like serine protease
MIVPGVSAALISGLLACTVPMANEPAGETTQDVIGGTEVVPGDLPWQVQLSIPGSPHVCGGSVIDNDWVLTAAHCVSDKTAPDFTARAGLHRRSAPDGNVQVRGVRRIIQHPSFNRATLENDIALLELATPLSYTSRVQPISIRSSDAPVGATSLISGWGQTAPGSGSTDALMNASLPVHSAATCNAAGTLPLLVRGSMVCAGFVGGARGGCQGDSGGPLVSPGGPTMPPAARAGLDRAYGSRARSAAPPAPPSASASSRRDQDRSTSTAVTCSKTSTRTAAATVGSPVATPEAAERLTTLALSYG